MIAAIGVGHKRAHQLLPVVDVHELTLLDDRHPRSRIADPDVDVRLAVAKHPVRGHLAHDRPRRIARLPELVGEGGRLRPARPRLAPVALSRRSVCDPLVRALLVVVGPEALEQELQVLEVRCRLFLS